MEDKTMGMKNKMAKLASIAAMMAVANGDEVYDCLPAVNHKTSNESKGEAKKCKSCRFYDGCHEHPKPMQIACGNYERRKKK